MSINHAGTMVGQAIGPQSSRGRLPSDNYVPRFTRKSKKKNFASWHNANQHNRFDRVRLPYPDNEKRRGNV